MNMPLQHSNHSEVAHLYERITCEQQAASWALTGLAMGTAQHWFISRRMERIGAYQEQLATLVGEQASMAIVIEIMENSPDQKREQAPQRRDEDHGGKTRAW
jgi:hypothetical protein